jgi:hypothetical protein
VKILQDIPSESGEVVKYNQEMNDNRDHAEELKIFLEEYTKIHSFSFLREDPHSHGRIESKNLALPVEHCHR